MIFEDRSCQLRLKRGRNILVKVGWIVEILILLWSLRLMSRGKRLNFIKLVLLRVLRAHVDVENALGLSSHRPLMRTTFAIGLFLLLVPHSWSGWSKSCSTKIIFDVGNLFLWLVLYLLSSSRRRHLRTSYSWWLSAQVSVSIASIRDAQRFIGTACLIWSDTANIERNSVLWRFSGRHNCSNRLRWSNFILLINFNGVFDSFLLHDCGRCRPNKLILLNLGQLLRGNLHGLCSRVDRTNLFITRRLRLIDLLSNFGILLNPSFLIVIIIIHSLGFGRPRESHFVRIIALVLFHKGVSIQRASR